MLCSIFLLFGDSLSLALELTWSSVTGVPPADCGCPPSVIICLVLGTSRLAKHLSSASQSPCLPGALLSYAFLLAPHVLRSLVSHHYSKCRVGGGLCCLLTGVAV